MAQDDGRLSALRTGRFTPRKYFRYSFLLEAESTPGSYKCTVAYWNKLYITSLLLFLFCFHKFSSSSSSPPSSSSSLHSLFLFVLSIVYSTSITCSLLLPHSFFCILLFPLSNLSIFSLRFFSDVLFLDKFRLFIFSSGLLSHFLQIRLRSISFFFVFLLLSFYSLPCPCLLPFLFFF